MEFLYKLYSNNYFGIGLFIVITILAFLFLVILFFGKKDEKARNKVENQIEKEENVEKVEKTETLNENTGILEPIALEEPVKEERVSEMETIEENDESFIAKEEPILEPISEETITFEETPREEMDPFVTSNIVLNTDYITESNEMNTPEEDSSLNNDIYNLNSLINEEQEESEEETIDDVLSKYDAIEETILEEVEETPEENASIIEEENELDIFTKPEDPLKKSSTPFSSVYLTKDEAEEKRKEEDLEPMQTPSRVKFDLPKRSDNGIHNTNIISNIEEKNTKVE